MVMDNSNQSIEIDFKTNVHTDNDTWWMRRDCDECDSPVADVTSCGARVPINLFWRCHVMYRSLEMASSPDIGSMRDTEQEALSMAHAQSKQQKFAKCGTALSTPRT
eukprot:380702_1